MQIDGDFRPTAVAQDGKLVALIGIDGNIDDRRAGDAGAGRDAPLDVRRSARSRGIRQRVRPNGDGPPMGVFVIEYLAANTYRVRVIDTATGSSGLPLNLRDKSQTSTRS